MHGSNWSTVCCVEPLLSQQYACSRPESEQCERIAQPLLRDPHYIFPDNMNDIDFVCRTWSRFVECVNGYIGRCFNDERKQEFQRAIQSPVDSVHQMCEIPTYQSEYLTHASCIKSTVTQNSHCGLHYQYLVQQVQTGDVERSSLCCSHHRFRECVLDQTARQCDSRIGNGGIMAPSGSASRFGRQIMDKALSFLRDQCAGFVPNSADCPSLGLPPDALVPIAVNDNGAGGSDSRGNSPRPPITPWGETRVRPSGRRGKTTVPPMPMPGQTPGPPPPPKPKPPQPSADVASASDNRPWPTSASGRSTEASPGDPVNKVDWPPNQKPPGPWLPGRVEPVSLRPTLSGNGGTTPTTVASEGSTVPTRSPSFSRGISWGPSASSPTEPWLPTKVSSNAVDEPNPQGLGIAGSDSSSNDVANYRGSGASGLATNAIIISTVYGLICVRLMLSA